MGGKSLPKGAPGLTPGLLLPAFYGLEVAIGPLADPHEVEMFITQYLNVQAERKWPSLAKVTAVIAPEANLDENGRRQVQCNLRAA